MYESSSFQFCTFNKASGTTSSFYWYLHIWSRVSVNSQLELSQGAELNVPPNACSPLFALRLFFRHAATCVTSHFPFYVTSSPSITYKQYEAFCFGTSCEQQATRENTFSYSFIEREFLTFINLTQDDYSLEYIGFHRNRTCDG